MIAATNTARKLMDMFSIDDVPCNESSFIDIESVLNVLRSIAPCDRCPTNYTISSVDSRIQMTPKENCLVRPYQMDVLNKIFKNNIIYPTLVVMPCGSGKTFTGACVISMIQCRSLVITNYKVVANQWKREILKYFDINEDQVQSIGEESFAFSHENPPMITILTYDSVANISSLQSRSLVKNLLFTNFTTIILDEAHKCVASSYFNIIARLKGNFMALTATPVREDSDMKLLEQLVDHHIEVDKQDLIAKGYISRVVCSTIIVPTHSQLYANDLTQHERVIAASINPNKLLYLSDTLKCLRAVKHRIIVFCDDIWSMWYIFKQLRKSHPIIGPIDMRTKITDREHSIKEFLAEDKGTILMISRTGDEGIDVPSASIIIQVCTAWGSRRQHAQRIGRIQRPYSASSLCCEAISIVSENTIEVNFAKKRDEYLQNMNYDVHTQYIDVHAKANNTKIIQMIKNRKSTIPIKNAINKKTKTSCDKPATNILELKKKIKRAQNEKYQQK